MYSSLSFKWFFSLDNSNSVDLFNFFSFILSSSCLLLTLEIQRNLIIFIFVADWFDSTIYRSLETFCFDPAPLAIENSFSWSCQRPSFCALSIFTALFLKILTSFFFFSFQSRVPSFHLINSADEILPVLWSLVFRIYF